MNKIYAIALGITICSLSLNAVGKELQRVENCFATFRRYLDDFTFCENLQMGVDCNPEDQSETVLSMEAIRALMKAKAAFCNVRKNEEGTLDFHADLDIFYKHFACVLEDFLERIIEKEPEAVDRKRACFEKMEYENSDTHTVERLFVQIGENIVGMQKVAADSMEFSVGSCGR